jgi:cytidylate kinase
VAIITISRGSLSGGRAVAECLGRRLSYPVVGREVLQEAAEKVGVSPEALQGKFETTPGLWARLTRDREKYLAAVQTALAEWCTRGDLVYHGLGGQFLLKDLPWVLRVQILAPMSMRIDNLMATHHRMTRDQVVAFIKKVDQERARWVRVMHGANVMDSSLYDLTINLKALSLESACVTIAEAASQPRFTITPEMETDIFAFAASCRQRLAQITGG